MILTFIKINAAYDIITLDHVNVVADLAAALNDHHQSQDETGDGQVITSNLVIHPGIKKTLTFLESLPAIAITVIIVLVSICLISRNLLIICKCQAPIRKCFNTNLSYCAKIRPVKRKNKTQETDIEAPVDQSNTSPLLPPTTKV